MTELFGYPTPLTIFWAILAAVGAAIVFWLATRDGEAPPFTAWVAIVLLAAVSTIPVIGYLRSLTPYHVRVIVSGVPDSDQSKLKVWSSAENDSAKVNGGWQIDIPSSQVPGGRTVMVWAAIEPGDLNHSKTVMLRNDHWPTVLISVGKGQSKIAGFLRDADGRAVNGAFVGLAGKADTVVFTAFSGSFLLTVPVAEGEAVELEASAFGKLTNVWATGGDQDFIIKVGK